MTISSRWHKKHPMESLLVSFNTNILEEGFICTFKGKPDIWSAFVHRNKWMFRTHLNSPRWFWVKCTEKIIDQSSQSGKKRLMWKKRLLIIMLSLGMFLACSLTQKSWVQLSWRQAEERSWVFSFPQSKLAQHVQNGYNTCVLKV